MFCTKCGSKASEGASFCQSCGVRLVDNANVQPIQGETPKKVPIRYIVIALCLVVGGLLIGKAIFSKGGSDVSVDYKYDKAPTTTSKVQCLNCNGTGSRSCVDCSGTGVGYGEWRAHLGDFEKDTCYTCYGSGRLTCGYCSGTGWR